MHPDALHLRHLLHHQDLENRQSSHHRLLIDDALLERLEIRLQHDAPDRARVVLRGCPPVARGVEVLRLALRGVVEDGLGLDGVVRELGGALAEDFGAQLEVGEQEVGV